MDKEEAKSRLRCYADQLYDWTQKLDIDNPRSLLNTWLNKAPKVKNDRNFMRKVDQYKRSTAQIRDQILDAIDYIDTLDEKKSGRRAVELALEDIVSREAARSCAHQKRMVDELSKSYKEAAK